MERRNKGRKEGKNKGGMDERKSRKKQTLISLKYVFDLIRRVAVRTAIQKNLDADFLDT